jgi:sarcosine oxidase, subunit beta
VVLADMGEIAGGATGKAMGGVRQQFSTEAEVRLVQASLPLFRELGPPLFDPVGYLFVATTEPGAAELEARLQRQRALGVPVERADAAAVPGLRAEDVVTAITCREDGTAEPAAVTCELVRRAAERGVEVREHTDALRLPADVLVIACGARSAAVAAARGVELPVRPLVRQLVEVGPVAGLPERLPMVVEAETGFHFRRAGRSLRLAMPEPVPRWGDREEVDEALVDDWRARAARRYPAAADAPLARTWAGLYDMTPDAHPIVGSVADGVYAACGFSGHGFMQAPAVGEAVACELLGLQPPVELSPYRLNRFAAGAGFPETLVL